MVQFQSVIKMEIMEGCLPCLLRQAGEAAKKVGSDPETEKNVLIKTKEILARFKEYENAPHLAEAIHGCVKKYTKNSDPYKAQKQSDLAAAKSLIPILKSFIDSSSHKLYSALKVSCVGNNLDSAVYSNMDIKDCIETELNTPFTLCDKEIFEEKLKNAKSILIIGDNAGEAVFDKVFMDSLSGDVSFTYAVRSTPIINDVTVLEAKSAGIDKSAKIIASGSTAPGTVLSEVSEEFKEALKTVDIVISKGQGNFESLSEIKGIFFLLKAKCPVIAQRFGVTAGSYIFKYNT